MKSTEKPTLITVPFAKDGNYNEIATKSTESSLAKGIATYQSGFPPLTMTAISAGGVPPSGKDMNGILNDITTAIRYSMSGGLYSYNADFSAAIDGYPKGAIVASSDGSKIWWNGVEDNNTDPDSTSVSGWKNLLADPNGLFLQKANNLSDINNKATARNNLGLGEIATQDFIPDATLIEKGITQLTDKTGNSNTLAATQKFVSDVNDNANNKLAKNQNGADIFNKTEFVKNIGLSETVELAKGAVPNSRKINGKPLTGDISLNAGDVGSYAKSESDNTFLRISSNKTATVGSLLIDSKTPFPKLRFKSKDGYILGINGSEGKLLHIYSDDPKNQRRYNILTPERSGTLALQNTAIKSENGWWQCGDTGVIIQWVKVPSAQQSWIKINYPISFKNKLFGYIASMSSINTSTGHTLVRNATLSTFEYQAGTPNNDENPGKVVHILFWGV